MSDMKVANFSIGPIVTNDMRTSDIFDGFFRFNRTLRCFDQWLDDRQKMRFETLLKRRGQILVDESRSSKFSYVIIEQKPCATSTAKVLQDGCPRDIYVAGSV